MENIRMDLRLFDANTQVTTQQSLTEEMKTFYSDYLIDAAEPELVHDQFAQKHPIPVNGGKTIQFRRFAPLGKALTALTEGVTPDGQSLSMSTVEAPARCSSAATTCSTPTNPCPPATCCAAAMPALPTTTT